MQHSSVLPLFCSTAAPGRAWLLEDSLPPDLCAGCIDPLASIQRFRLKASLRRDGSRLVKQFHGRVFRCLPNTYGSSKPAAPPCPGWPRPAPGHPPPALGTGAAAGNLPLASAFSRPAVPCTGCKPFV
jgi:hypothetical protein